MMEILSSEYNTESYSDMLDNWTFVQLDEYKTILAILADSKLATTLDNRPE
jgi:hypothetical protein